MQSILVVLAVLITAIIGTFSPLSSPFIVVVFCVILAYLLWIQKQKGFKPQSQTYKELEKLKKKRLKTEENKHKHINDQIAYIREVWGYTKEQERLIKKFIEKRAYSAIYNKLTASLLPQMITLIDKCNAQDKRACKREVSRRLRELTNLMKQELQNTKYQKIESFETTLEVYDKLLYK